MSAQEHQHSTAAFKEKARELCLSCPPALWGPLGPVLRVPRGALSVALSSLPGSAELTREPNALFPESPIEPAASWAQSQIWACVNFKFHASFWEIPIWCPLPAVLSRSWDHWDLETQKPCFSDVPFFSLGTSLIASSLYTYLLIVITVTLVYECKVPWGQWIIVVFPGKEKESFPLSFTCILSVTSFPLHGLSVVLKALTTLDSLKQTLH